MELIKLQNTEKTKNAITVNKQPSNVAKQKKMNKILFKIMNTMCVSVKMYPVTCVEMYVKSFVMAVIWCVPFTYTCVIFNWTGWSNRLTLRGESTI